MEVFGGGICHVCASLLVKKQSEDEHEKPPISSAILGKKKRLKIDMSQSLPMRLIRLAAEMLIFCGFFVGFTYAFMHSSNWLATQMESTLPRFKVHSNGVRYFWYIGCLIIIMLTAKYRFKPNE